MAIRSSSWWNRAQPFREASALTSFFVLGMSVAEPFHASTKQFLYFLGV
jgi:hypothetical protein